MILLLDDPDYDVLGKPRASGDDPLLIPDDQSRLS